MNRYLEKYSIVLGFRLEFDLIRHSKKGPDLPITNDIYREKMMIELHGFLIMLVVLFFFLFCFARRPLSIDFWKEMQCKRKKRREDREKKKKKKRNDSFMSKWVQQKTCHLATSRALENHFLLFDQQIWRTRRKNEKDFVHSSTLVTVNRYEQWCSIRSFRFCVLCYECSFYLTRCTCFVSLNNTNIPLFSTVSALFFNQRTICVCVCVYLTILDV